jgi:hypothetical protein
MKKLSFAFMALFASAMIFAQSEKYMSAMQPKVAAIDTVRNADSLENLAGAFERIGNAEKTQWLPFYYAALAKVNAGNQVMNSLGATSTFGNNSDKLDPYAARAEELLDKAEALSKDNSEIFIVKKMIATLRLMGDPMNRYMTYGPEGAQALETAKKLNPENPRIYLLEGMDKYFTPEQYGGSKEDAKKLLEQAQKKYASFKPESSIHPTWGKGMVDYFLGQMK